MLVDDFMYVKEKQEPWYRVEVQNHLVRAKLSHFVPMVGCRRRMPQIRCRYQRASSISLKLPRSEAV